MPGFYILILLFCVPPILSLLATFRRFRLARQRGRPGVWLLLGAAFSFAALAFNAAVAGAGVMAVGAAGIELGRIHAWAAGLAWICLWIWIVALIVFRGHRHRTY